MERVLEKVYSDPKHAGSFTSLKKIKKALPVKISEKKIKKWLRGKNTFTMHRPARKNFKRNQIVAGHIDAQWQADLADMSNLAQHNDGVTFLLVVIDIVSKYAWVEPVKNKSAVSLVAAFKKVLKDRKPLKLQTDDGKEFLNRGVQQLLKENNITFFTVKSDKKAAVAERFVRTIKEKIWRYMYEKNTKRYIDVLKDLVQSYNKTYHASIKMAPADVTEENEGEVLRTLYGKDWIEGVRGKQPKLQKGDFVRLSVLKGPFGKGFMGNWTEAIYIIEVILHRVPEIVYKVKEWDGTLLEGSFYEKELQLVDADLRGLWKVEKVIRRRKRRGVQEYYVKWEGYDNNHNSWVRADKIRNIT